MSSQRWPLAKTWTRWTKQAGLGVAGASRVPDAEGDLDRLGLDEGRAAGQRDAADPRGCGGEGAQRAGEVLHVVPRRHVAGVARLQLVVQALHQLILGSGGDNLHACLYTRILTRTAKEMLLVQGLHQCRPWTNSILQRKTVQKSYSCSPYIYVRTTRIAFCNAKQRKTVQKKLSPRRVFYFFLRSLNVSRQLVKAGRRQAPASGTGARPRARLGLGQGHGVQAPGEGARRVGLRLADCEEARLLAGLPEVLLPVRSVKC